MTKTVDREKFRQLYMQDLSAAQIAAELGCHENYVSNLASKLGMPQRRGSTRHLPDATALSETSSRSGRIERDAERILAGVMARRNWTCTLRDNLAAEIDRIVTRELHRARTGAAT